MFWFLAPVVLGIGAKLFFDDDSSSPLSSHSDCSAEEEKAKAVAKERERHKRREREAICSYAGAEMSRIVGSHNLGPNLPTCFNFYETRELAELGSVLRPSGPGPEYRIRHEFHDAAGIKASTAAANQAKAELEKLERMREILSSQRRQAGV